MCTIVNNFLRHGIRGKQLYRFYPVEILPL